MVDVAFLLLMFGLLGGLFHRTRVGWVPVVRSLVLFGICGFLLAVALSSRFGTLRLLDYWTFLHLPIALGTLGRWRLVAGWGRFAMSGLAPLCLVAVGVWSHWIEPNWLEINSVTLHSSKIEQPLTIAVVADIQTDRIGSYERKVIRQVVAQQPDLILLTGDYLQGSGAEVSRLVDPLRQLLRDEHFTAPLGVFAVRGDIDHKSWAQSFAGLPITTLEATTTFELEDFTLSGLSAFESRYGPAALPVSDRFHIVFGHAPDYALHSLSADLQIAGHTHGGQVRLPFLGPPITFSRVPRSWAAGVTDLGGGRTLVVSRGIGMERGSAPRLRFLCRPEIVVLHVLPEASGGA